MGLTLPPPCPFVADVPLLVAVAAGGAEAVLALAVVAVAVLPLHAPVAVLLPVSAAAVSVALAVQLAVLTLAVVALAVRPLDDTGGSYPSTGVSIPSSVAVAVTKHYGRKDEEEESRKHGQLW